MNKMVHMLRLSDVLRESSIRSALAALRLPAGSCGLDAGCGIGSHTRLLAEAVGPDGHVTGVDSSTQLLAHAIRGAAASGLQGRVAFRRGDITRLRFDDDAFDWLWSVDCVGFVGSDPVALVRELERVVRPGGAIAFLVWSSQQLLPGHPVLEARLNATAQGIAPFVRGRRPQRHFLRALGWLRDAGLQEPRARTFVGDVHAPLTGEVRAALLSLFEMRWANPRSEISSHDWEEFRRVCGSDSPDLILDSPDYYAFFTYSMFSGTVRR